MPVEENEASSTTTGAMILPPKPSDDEALKLLREHAPDPSHSHQRIIGYGTAGFRQVVKDTPQLTSIMIRTAAFATLRSLKLQGQALGIMITASHNDESYNGVKIADPDGGMMAGDAEASLVNMANLESVDELWQRIVEERNSATSATTTTTTTTSTTTTIIPTLYLGRDTRSHSVTFGTAMIQLAQALGARCFDLGVVTTPCLHHSVLHANFIRHLPTTLIPCRPHVEGYLELLAHSYVALLQTNANSTTTSKTLVVDCACGVGYPALQQLTRKIESIAQFTTLPLTHILPTNGPGMGPLNQNCGSEHVQKGIGPPTWYRNDNDRTDDKSYCAAVDGDADRIVFFANGPDPTPFLLLDGDKIACLLCEFVQEQLDVVQQAVLNTDKDNTNIPALKLGVVQTAYANGASTHYLEQHVLQQNGNNDKGVLFTKTGVKHLHAAAHHELDVGIYFEANGHGTILFGPAFYHFVASAQQALLFGNGNGTTNFPALTALQRLALLPSLVNQAVGDALSDLLLVDAILQIKGWTLTDWDAMYQDYPSRQVKVRVQDRSMIQTNDNETRCTSPPQVQVELDQAMAALSQNGGGVARTFVRPSGTEDVVRIYAEASTREQADELARQACAIVYELCQGVGDLPTIAE
mmetsp:Transcript_14772/g.40830  ORF Transcript_14772/g.40830 Transcript_14772/m.40830 type:complete len:639 (+) Transcript_14772:67-1983(+)